MFHNINFGIDDVSSSERTFSTASICCSASGWLNKMAKEDKELMLDIVLTTHSYQMDLLYLMSTTCTKIEDSAISSSVALKAATYRKKNHIKDQFCNILTY